MQVLPRRARYLMHMIIFSCSARKIATLNTKRFNKIRIYKNTYVFVYLRTKLYISFHTASRFTYMYQQTHALYAVTPKKLIVFTARTYAMSTLECTARARSDCIIHKHLVKKVWLWFGAAPPGVKVQRVRKFTK